LTWWHVIFFAWRVSTTALQCYQNRCIWVYGLFCKHGRDARAWPFLLWWTVLKFLYCI